MGDQHHDLYNDEQALVEGQHQHQHQHHPQSQQQHQSSPVASLDQSTGATASTSPQLSSISASHKRKRDSIDDTEGRDDGRSGREGSSSGRRSSLRQTSPSISNISGSFMPINANAAPNPAGSYNFGQMPLPQPASTAPLNGSANSNPNVAMSGLLSQMTASPQSLGYAPTDGSGTKNNESMPLDASYSGMTPAPQPTEGHSEGVGSSGVVGAHVSSPVPPVANIVHHSHSHGHGHSTMSVGSSGNPKPQVGTEEWHRVRRDNHKEVERRRRETINEGINELAKIVPGCEKNKGSILQRAVQYIQQLKENEASNIEKWTLEKLLTEQAIAELSANNEKLQKECERAWREAETWKKSCLQAGVTRDNGGQTSSS